MGKGGGKVYDILMSIDYALCLGPVDWVNQIWIKDKPIWCGRVDKRSNVHVRLPKLFGGDEKEGGVEGCVEVYMGTDSQYLSDEAAARFTPDGEPGTHQNMPGYRGLCHLFFRGGPGLNEAQYEALLKTFDKNGFDPNSPGAEPAEIGDPINQSYKDRGFKWMANNPYIPEMKASVSRFPKRLAGANTIINSGVEGGATLDREYSTSPVTLSFPINEGPEGIPFIVLKLVPYDVIPTYADWAMRNSGFGTREGHFLPFDERTIEDGMVSYSWSLHLEWAKAHYHLGQVGTVYRHQTQRNGELEGRDDPEWGVDYDLSFHESTVTANIEANTLTWHPGPRDYGQPLTPWNRYDSAFWVQSGIQANSGYGHITGQVDITYYPFKTHCSLNGSNADIGDANPAQIIYELLVDTEWGAQQPEASIDTASFTSAAATLAGERFGLSFLWTRQDSVAEFIKVVLDHIQAFLYIDPQTGLWTLRLIRDDFDRSALEELDPTDTDFTKQGRRSWGEVINEIVVVYTDPDTGDDTSVSAHNPTALALQGEVVSETRNFPGICNHGLAKVIAQREADAAGYPGWSGTAKVSRARWAAVPGTRYRLNWPEDGIDKMVVMVVSVDYGKPSDRTITLELIEDIFSRERTRYQEPQGALWEPVNNVPVPLDYRLLLEVPLPLMQQAGVTVAEVDGAYPGGSPLMPMGHSARTVVSDIAVHRTATELVATVAPRRATPLPGALLQEVTSTLPSSVAEYLSQGGEQPGVRYWLGNRDETGEIIELVSLTGGNWTVRRGVWDTVPKDWPQGAMIWSLGAGRASTDQGDNAIGESITYRMLPVVGSRTLEYGFAAPTTRTVTGRPHKPFRPANLALDGDAGFGLKSYDPAPASITITWANRNRRLEEGAPLQWDAASVTPETGQTTTIRVVDARGVVIEEVAGLTGTSYAMTITPAMQEYGMEFIELWSVRDGVESLQAARRQVHLVQHGWGSGWNEDWGGTLGV